MLRTVPLSQLSTGNKTLILWLWNSSTKERIPRVPFFYKIEKVRKSTSFKRVSVDDYLREDIYRNLLSYDYHNQD